MFAFATEFRDEVRRGGVKSFAELVKVKSAGFGIPKGNRRQGELSRQRETERWAEAPPPSKCDKATFV